MMKQTLLAAGLCAGLAACVAGPDSRSAEAPLQTVESVDLTRNAGTWYEIAHYPNAFQRGCSRTTAEYGLRDDGKVSVTNSCFRNGKTSVAEGRARVVDGSGGAKLKVSFAPDWITWLPFAEGDYWIVWLDEDYRNVVVGAPSGRYLWLLSRDRQPDAASLAAMKAAAEAKGFALDPLSWTDQSPLK